MRAGVTDFGMTTTPCASSHARTACAGVTPALSATRRITGSSRRPCPDPSGEYASVTIPSSAWNRRDSRCCEYGCSSIWLTAGATPVSSTSREMCSGRKFETPMLRTRPSPLSSTQRPPCVDVAVQGRRGPVDQEQVDHVQAEPVQRAVERGAGPLVALPTVPDLRGDEQLVPRDAALGGTGDGAAHPGLVAVRGRGVDGPVAGVDRVPNRSFGARGRRPARPRGRAAGSRRRDRRRARWWVRTRALRS